MHIAAKILLILGALICVGGIIVGALGGMALGEIEEFELKNVSEGEIKISDEDGMGELGVTFWTKGEYVDENTNGKWDHCENMNVTINEKPPLVSRDKFFGTDAEYSSAVGLNGSFYYEVYEYMGCKVSDENENLDKSGQGLIKLGRACYGCSSGTLNFTMTNGTVWVSYDDKVLGEAAEGFFGLLGGGALLCCGVIFLIIGLILVFTVKDNAYQPVMVQGPDGQMVMVQSNQPSEQAVMIQQPPQGGL